MKIGFDAKRAFFNNRGLGNYSRDTIRILTTKASQNEYFLFTPKTKGGRTFQHGDASVVAPSSFFSKALPSLWRTSGCSKDAEKLGLDIYHGLSNELPYGLPKSIATVVTIHDLIFLKNPELYPFFDRYTFRKKYVRSCQVADRIVAISEETKKDLLELVGVDERKVSVVYQGCNPIFAKEADEATQESVRNRYSLPADFMLIVCAIEKRKNHELILEAMHIGHFDIPLVIVGRPSAYKDELMQLIHKYGLENRVIFLHQVPMEDLPLLYRLATLFVYPSHFEGFGIPILEAMTSHTPVITSIGSCFKETGGEAARYVDSHKAEELSNAIEEILTDRELAQKMVKEGDLQAMKFSDESIATAMTAVYNSLAR